MPPEAAETTTIPEPEDSGVEPSQVEASIEAAAVVPVSRDLKDAIGQSTLTAAIREAGTAFRAAAPQIIFAHWSEDLTRRLDGREREVTDLRQELMTEREQRARLEERLSTISERNAAQDFLKVVGGAVLGLGLTHALSGGYFLGVIIIIFGALLAYFGGVSIPGVRR